MSPKSRLARYGLWSVGFSREQFVQLAAAGRVEKFWIEDDGYAAALLNKLAKIYVAPDAEWPPPPWHENPPDGWITRITPVRVRGWGSWQEANPLSSSAIPR